MLKVWRAWVLVLIWGWWEDMLDFQYNFRIYYKMTFYGWSLPYNKLSIWNTWIEYNYCALSWLIDHSFLLCIILFQSIKYTNTDYVSLSIIIKLFPHSQKNQPSLTDFAGNKNSNDISVSIINLFIFPYHHETPQLQRFPINLSIPST
jgi:hypothetical protein